MSDDTHMRIADYEILGVLGSGGMGQVYKVRNVISERVEAMKILLPDLAGRQELAERFLREIKVLATLDHPNIAALRTALTVNNQLVMIMEYVEGVTLAQQVEQGPLPTAQALDYVDQILAALSYAHQRQVIHRDIKPSNMMVTPQGIVKLMDFGIARSQKNSGHTVTGTTLGSLCYISPEQVTGAATDARSDLYSLGVSLYEMVTGQRPFQAESDYSILAAHVQQLPKPPIELRSDLPSALNEIILIAMKKSPADRFQSAEAFRTALASLRSSLPAQDMTAESAAPAVAPAPPTAAGLATSFFNEEASPVAQPDDLATTPVQAPPPQVGHYGTDSPPPISSSHRGLYMSLGALIVLVVLLGAGLYGPWRTKAKARQEIGSDVQPPADTSRQSTQPLSDPPNPPAEESNVGNNSATPPPDSSLSTNTEPAKPPASVADGRQAPGDSSSTAPKDHVSGQNRSRAFHVAKDQSITADTQVGTGSVAGDSEHNAGSGSADEQSAMAAQWEELELQLDQLSSRANAVSSSLDTLQRQQAAQGVGLRGDIAASQERLRSYTARAQAAMQHQDPKSAQKYLNLAQVELETIERFLGR